MICPRCSVGEISETTQECLVCGFSRTGGVIVESSDWNRLDDPVLPALERQFQVEGVLRRGAAARIYLARDQVTGRLCSLKVLPLAAGTPASVVEQFRQEAQRAASLDHPHIVAVHRFGTIETALWYAMEYVQGRSLGDLLRTADRMELKTCQRLVEQIASALEYGHRRGIPHGNLKPSNVLVDPEGWARVADFGVNGAFGTLPRRQPESSFEENYGHVAPERFGSAGVVGPAADQYALAVLTFSCLARRPPFVGETLDEITRHHLEGPVPQLAETRPDLPPHVATALARAMSRSPGDRFAGVLDFVTALAGVAVPEAAPAIVRSTPVEQTAAVAEAAPAESPAPSPLPVAPPPTPPSPEPAVAAAKATAEPPPPRVEEQPRLPLLFVERSSKRARALDKDEDEEEDVATAKVSSEADAEEHEDDEQGEKETREPVLLWPAAREHPAPAAAAAGAHRDAGEEKEEAHPSRLLVDAPRPRKPTLPARALVAGQRLIRRWQVLPRTTRIGSGAGVGAAVLLLALLWWRVARGREETRPNWSSEAPPAGLTESTAIRPTGTRPAPPPRPSGTPRVATPPAGVGVPTTRPDTGTGKPRSTPQPQIEPAHLFINATPWGLLFIDDQPVGNTPKADLQIPPGDHRIRITRDGFLPYETEIAIEAGETLRLTDIVLQEKPQ